MNAPLFDFATAPEAGNVTDWAALTTAVNIWRGRSLHLFARAEAAASEALLLLAKDATLNVTLPLMVGPRFDELDRVLALRDDASGKAAVAMLRRFRHHDRLRVFFCHGVATVLADRQGGRYAIFELLAFKNGAPARDKLFVSNGEAAERYKMLQSDETRLDRKLAALTTC